jgi:hypothetical protein
MRPGGITIVLSWSGRGWEFVTLNGGKFVAASKHECFDHSGRALIAAIRELKPSMDLPPAPGSDGPET